MTESKKLNRSEKETVLGALVVAACFTSSGQLPAATDAAAERTAHSSKPALMEFLKEARDRFTMNPESESETPEPVVTNYGRNFANYARNFANYARNFANYARNFSNYARNFSNVIIEEPKVLETGTKVAMTEATLPNGRPVPKDVADVLASIRRRGGEGQMA